MSLKKASSTRSGRGSRRRGTTRKMRGEMTQKTADQCPRRSNQGQKLSAAVVPCAPFWSDMELTGAPPRLNRFFINLIEWRSDVPAHAKLKHLVGTFLKDLQIGPHDDAKLRIRAGVVSAHVKRADGRVQSATTMLNGQFRRLTAFDPSGLSRTARRKVVRQLRKEGLRQTAIADLLGVSQATVSLDLRP